MILSDGAIKKAVEAKEIGIEPFDERGQLGPASYDVTLHPKLLVRPSGRDGRWTRDIFEPLDLADVREQEYLTEYVMEDARGYTMQPGEFLLASTHEYLTLGPAHAARVEGRSSLARVGLAVHVTGGFIDPGFSGQITLEMKNLLHRPVIIYAGMSIAQIAFQVLDGPVERPYGERGRYQDQVGPTASRYYLPYGPDHVRWLYCTCWEGWAGTSTDWDRKVGQSAWCSLHEEHHMMCPSEECCLEL